MRTIPNSSNKPKSRLHSLFSSRVFLSLISTWALLGCKSSIQKPVDDAPATEVTSPSPISDAVGNNADSISSPFCFEEAASQWSVNVAYRNSEETEQNAMIENLGGGVAFLDFDRNGLPDIAATSGGTIGTDQKIGGIPTKLLQHNENQYVDVGLEAGFESEDLYTHGLCVLDCDNDGFEDLLVTGYGSVVLWRNMGDGRFLRSKDDIVSELTGWFTSAASGDFNGDGFLDMYLCRYVDWSFENNPFCFSPERKRELCSPLDFKGQNDVLLTSNGDGSWSDSTSSAGLSQAGKGLGVLTCDIDDDGDLDIYVANDTTANFLYINQGDGRLEEVAEIRGAAVDERALPNGSMGVLAIDVNRDLRTDLWVTNFEREAFAVYRNEGDANFLHTSRRYGLGALGGNFVGFGTECQDLNLDGQEEIVVTNGHVLKYPVATPRSQNPLLLIYEKQRFVRHIPICDYFAKAHQGRGLATADIDRDGRLDLAITHINAPMAILMNRSPAQGDSLRVRLVGTVSNRDAIGARVILTTAQRRLLRNVVGGASYLSQSDRMIQFGLQPDEVAQSLSIRWPNSITTHVIDLSGQGKNSQLLCIQPYIP